MEPCCLRKYSQLEVTLRVILWCQIDMAVEAGIRKSEILPLDVVIWLVRGYESSDV